MEGSVLKGLHLSSPVTTVFPSGSIIVYESEERVLGSKKANGKTLRSRTSTTVDIRTSSWILT